MSSHGLCFSLRAVIWVPEYKQMVKTREGVGRDRMATNSFRISAEGKGKWARIVYPGRVSYDPWSLRQGHRWNLEKQKFKEVLHGFLRSPLTLADILFSLEWIREVSRNLEADNGMSFYT